MVLEHITEKMIREHYQKTLFWLKSDGDDCCKATLQDPENYICMKTLVRGNVILPLDCKYFQINYDFPDLSQCNYKR